MKHTPGPWRTFFDATGFWKTRIIAPEDGDLAVAIIYTERPETEANAHLIAAAPELLEALEGMLGPDANGDPPHTYYSLPRQIDCCVWCDLVHPEHRPDCPVTKAQDAIAKARGDHDA